METRSLTIIKDDRKEICCIYRQMDGYIEGGMGEDLANFLADMRIVNGFGRNDKAGTAANGMGCLAAQLVAHLKKDIGGPPPLTLKTDVTFSVLPTLFATVLHQVEEAISSDESRYVLNGIFFDGKDGPLILVGTDGRRLHKASLMPAETPFLFPKGFILPKYAVPHLHKLLKEQPEGVPVKVEVNTERNLIQFTGTRLTMMSKLIEGQFPNYPQVIPLDESIKIRVAVDVPAWITALEAVKPFTSEAWNSVKVILSDNLATFLVKNTDVGEGTATVAINNKGTVNIFFDPDYLIDALLPHKEASYEVTIGFIDDVSPCVITTPTTTTVIMPKRIS